MKTTLELSDGILRKAKVRAAAQGITLKQLFHEALEEKLAKGAHDKSNPGWLKLAGAFGKTSADRAETRRIQKVIDAEFEQIDGED